MSPFVIILFILAGAGIFFIQRKSHEARINDYVESFGGKVLSVEHKTFNTGPFLLVGKGRNVYRFEYSEGGIEKEGWVKFGGLMGPDWRL